jgi:cell fate regulator YaaT (PSP1 superfamily)
MELPANHTPFDCLEVRFKNGRKEFYRNVNDLSVHIGDIVAVEGSPGHDIGIVSLTGELVKLQMKKKKQDADSKEIKKLYRKATQRDIDTWQSAREKEQNTMMRTRQLALDLGLTMKISDVEYQGDGGKATFFYTAEDRVDFRELIKKMAFEFKIRIEMRQIGSRQEAGRVGGIGSCGRELCCTTWLTDFRSVNTSAARYQQLSLNPQKLAGQCGKLKCCLNYELDTYVDALKEFPETMIDLETKKGHAIFQKMDIFKKKVWYSYKNEAIEWIPLEVEALKEIISLNEKGQKVESLEDYSAQIAVAEVALPDFDNVVGQDSLTRFDHKKNRKGGRGNSRNKKGRTQNRNRNHSKSKPRGEKK